MSTTTYMPAQQMAGSPAVLTPQITELLQIGKTRAEKCRQVANKYLAVEMDDNTDDAIQGIIANCKTAVEQMRSGRMVYTKAFDEIKKMFTSQESEIEACQTELQVKRNKYAAVKLEAKRREEAQLENERRKAQELIELKKECDMQLAAHFTRAKENFVKVFVASLNATTADNYDEKVERLNSISLDLKPEILKSFAFAGSGQYGHNLNAIQEECIERNADAYKALWHSFMTEMRTDGLEQLRIRKSCNFEKSKTVATTVSTATDTKQIEVAAQVATIENNFEHLPTVEPTVNKIRQAVKIEITDKLGYQAIAAFWFLNFLQGTDLEKLEKKTLGSMVKDVEKHAKDTGEQITSPYLIYSEAITAVNAKRS